MRRAIVLLLLAAACRRPIAPLPAPGVVVTTNDAYALTQQLVAAFEKETTRHLAIRVVMPAQIPAATNAAAVFSGDLVLKGAKLRSVFAYEDFFIVGPSSDPARIRNSPAANEALRRIAKRHRRFCSPVDFETPVIASGVPCHGTPADVLAEASKLGAYTIVDRASAEKSMPRRYRILLRDVPPLHTAYSVALLAPATNRDAEWFVEWLMSYRGREVLGTVRGARLVLPEEH